MAPWLKGLAAKPDNPDLISRTHMVEGRVALEPPQGYTVACAPSPTHTCTDNKCKLNKDEWF